MYSDVFCKVYNELGWNYYPEAFGQQLLQWLAQNHINPKTGLDLACGTGILCEILHAHGIKASGMDFSAGMIEIAKKGNPAICYEVADMTTYRPEKLFDLVTCTGDALNHIGQLSDIEKVFQNVYAYTSAGGYFVFDILDEREVSESEPFELDFDESTRVWFQMTRPENNTVNLKIRVFENGSLHFEENIRETVYDPADICDLLRKCGFQVIRCDHALLDDPDHRATTWFVIARK